MLLEDMLSEAIGNTALDIINIKETSIGKIESVSPLSVRVDGLLLNYDDLYVNSELLNHTKYFEKLTGINGDNTTTLTNGSITFKSSLDVGDKVAIREINDGRYYIMSKVKGGY